MYDACIVPIMASSVNAAADSSVGPEEQKSSLSENACLSLPKCCLQSLKVVTSDEFRVVPFVSDASVVPGVALPSALRHAALDRVNISLQQAHLPCIRACKRTYYVCVRACVHARVRACPRAAQCGSGWQWQCERREHVCGCVRSCACKCVHAGACECAHACERAYCMYAQQLIRDNLGRTEQTSYPKFLLSRSRVLFRRRESVRPGLSHPWVVCGHDLNKSLPRVHRFVRIALAANKPATAARATSKLDPRVH